MIDMRKILKKTATLMMTAVIGVSMSCPKMIVYAGQRMQMQEEIYDSKKNGIIQKHSISVWIYR